MQSLSGLDMSATTRMDKKASSPCRDSISLHGLFTMPNLSAKSWKLWTLFRHIHCWHMHRNLYSVTYRDMSEVSTRGVCEQQQLTFRCRYTHRQKHVVSVQRQRFCSDILEDTLPVWKLPKARPLEIMLFKWLQSAHVRFT